MSDIGRDLLRSLELERYREGQSKTWELPPWRHPISAAVAPLFVAKNGCLHPLGTAFVISSLRIVLTAHHNLIFATRHHRSRQRVLEAVDDENLSRYSLDDLNLYVLLQGFNDEGAPEMRFWSVRSTVTPRPADLAYGLLGRIDPDPFKFLCLPLSPAVPRLGNRVWAVGYSGISVPRGGIPMKEVEDGTFDWDRDYTHRLVVCEAEVDLIFSRKLAQGFVEGPCVRIDGEIPHGLSGGPVISDRGYVCGVNTSGSTLFFEKPSSLVSILYPSMLSQLGLDAFNAVNPAETTRFDLSILDLIRLGKVVTDGSERLLRRSQHPSGGTMIHPLIHEDDLPNAFESFEDYQRDRPVERIFEGQEMLNLVLDQRISSEGTPDDG